MVPEKCKHLDATVQWDGAQRCLLKAGGKVSMLQVTSELGRMGIGDGMSLNDICPFCADEERKNCPWYYR